MKFYLGVTDNNWFSFLRNISPEEINFGQPGGKSNFKVLSPGAPFLFKLKHPYNVTRKKVNSIKEKKPKYINEYHRKNSEAAVKYLEETKKNPLDFNAAQQQVLKNCK